MNSCGEKNTAWIKSSPKKVIILWHFLKTRILFGIKCTSELPTERKKYNRGAIMRTSSGHWLEFLFVYDKPFNKLTPKNKWKLTTTDLFKNLLTFINMTSQSISHSVTYWQEGSDMQRSILRYSSTYRSSHSTHSHTYVVIELLKEYSRVKFIFDWWMWNAF